MYTYNRYTYTYGDRVKTKLTLSIDPALVPPAKRHARQRGLSLSQLVETALRAAAGEDDTGSFSARWRGGFRPAARADERYRALARRYHL